MNSTPVARPAAPEISARQRRAVRRTTWVVSLVAVAIYVGYIVISLMQTHR